ncbi:uncharacterized protein LOC111008457 [Momordica charantia]|uniref:Uncharacterized protein LOC111008457 n=1 Tax=Momordica charantia TaxID=3673 RepID=A0A6J1C5J8_MOMCH|nr:uncharacterized protein LOC111008457 [Momordica charantia]
MLVRKRPRPQMKRTASMSGIKVDVSHVEGGQPSDHHHSPGSWQNPPAIAADADLMNYTLSFVSPRGRRNLSAFNDGGDDSVHFLRTCTFCHRRLSPARDIYMYMGDTAFCSAECREQKMEQDHGSGGSGSKQDGGAVGRHL